MLPVCSSPPLKRPKPDSVASPNNRNMCTKLTKLREEMADACVDAYVVASEDAHQSEHVAPSAMRRSFLCNFTGSAGVCLVTDKEALLWTDGRYFLQAAKQLGPEWTLMRSGETGVLKLDEWFIKMMPRGAKLGVDPFLIASGIARQWTEKLEKGGQVLVSVPDNLVDKVWGDEQPAQPCTPLRIHPIEFSGRSVEDKLAAHRESLTALGCLGQVLSALDDVAWIFNIRGNDIDYCPLCISYAIITLDSAIMFVDQSKVTPEVGSHLHAAGVEVRGYDEMLPSLEDLVKTLPPPPADGEVAAERPPYKILLDPAQTSLAVKQVVPPDNVQSSPSPISLAKACKNEAELKGMRSCHVRDGVALTAFLAWLDEEMTATPEGSTTVHTETSIADKLEEFRMKQQGYLGPSFPTISGYGPNGAVIHYQAKEETALQIKNDSLLLLDSGGQYCDGTTDVTRTVHFGTPTAHQKRCNTLVLKGHIALAQVIFPEDTMGSKLDVLARMHLWREGLDYRHGTGHGVGAHLGVHEGPHGIHYRIRADEQGIMSTMITSNEPGFYEDDNFGIRIENICECVHVQTPLTFGDKPSCTFETITMAPIQPKLIDTTMLSPQELKWVNDYHAQVRREIGPMLKEMHPSGYRYMLRETEPLQC